ncbi:MAG: N-acetyltransferase [Planctomycetes bacterium]|nr:N-acetyltransferase [Planctomycetota bacterium]
MAVTVTPVSSRKQHETFIRFPRQLYRNNPHYIPPLLWERRQFFDPDKNPLFEFTDVAYFLAARNGNIVGRITAHINHRHNDYWNENTGCFGFFECIKDTEVAAALTSTAENWLRDKKIDVIRGPFNFSTNEECGMLVSGFDERPAIMMPYGKPYYPAFMEKSGYHKAQDLLAFEYANGGEIPGYLERFSKRIVKRLGITVRPLDTDNFENEVTRALEVYNEAWAENWGFVPMTKAQFRHMAHELRPIIDPDIALIVEKNGEPVAFALALPDYNMLLRKAHGRLLPFGWIHLLFGRSRIDHIRVITLGIKDTMRNKAIDVVLYYTLFRNGYRNGYHSCEMSWILADNVRMTRALERFGAWLTKRYRIYEKKL